MLRAASVDYVVVETAVCRGDVGMVRKGCSMKDLWDAEDPKLVRSKPICPVLLDETPLPFSKVFQNEDYVVFEIPTKFAEVANPHAARA